MPYRLHSPSRRRAYAIGNESAGSGWEVGDARVSEHIRISRTIQRDGRSGRAALAQEATAAATATLGIAAENRGVQDAVFRLRKSW